MSRKWVTISTLLVEEGDYKGKFITRADWYYFDTNEQAISAARDLKNIFNDHLDGDFGLQFDQDMGTRQQ